MQLHVKLRHLPFPNNFVVKVSSIDPVDSLMPPREFSQLHRPVCFQLHPTIRSSGNT